MIKRYVRTSMVCALAFGVTGSAFASDVTLDTTGPGSTQEVKIQNNSEIVETNTNIVQVTNENIQSAITGDVAANKNTTVGGLESGDATNSNSTTTAVEISNESVLNEEAPSGGSGSNGGTETGGAGGSSSTGAVMGASTTGGMGSASPATLPEVGASIPMDVSALRAAWSPQTNAASAKLAKGSSWFTGAMLLTATLLSLLGAIGSAWYAKRREERV